MGDQQDRPPRGGGEDVVEHGVAGVGVQVRGRLVEHQHLGVGEQRPGEREPAAHAAAEPRTLRADLGAEPVGQHRDVVGEPDPAQHVPQLVVAAPRPGQQQVVAQGRGEHVRVLRHPGQHAAGVVGVAGGDVDPVECDGAGVRVAEPEQHLGQRALARPAGADDGDAAAGFEVEVEPVERPGLVRAVAHAQVPDVHARGPARPGVRRSERGVRYVRLPNAASRPRRRGPGRRGARPAGRTAARPPRAPRRAGPRPPAVARRSRTRPGR